MATILLLQYTVERCTLIVIPVFLLCSYSYAVQRIMGVIKKSKEKKNSFEAVTLNNDFLIFHHQR